MKRLLTFIIFTVLTLPYVSALEAPVGNPDSKNAVVVNPYEKEPTNIYQEPDEDSPVAFVAAPKSIVWVTDISLMKDKWLRVSDGKRTGYVQIKYVSAINGDYKQYFQEDLGGVQLRNPNGLKYDQASGFKKIIMAPGAFMEPVFALPFWQILLICLPFYALEIWLVLRLKRRHQNGQSLRNHIYLCNFGYFIFLLFILIIFPFASYMDRGANANWLLMLLCALPLLVNTSWLLEKSGKDARDSDAMDDKIGKGFGIFVMVLCIVPIWIALNKITNEALWDCLWFTSSNFIGAIISVIVIAICQAVIMWMWLHIVNLFLKPLSNFSVNMLTAALIWILVMCEFDLIHYTHGFTYFVGSAGLILCALQLISLFTLLKERRCFQCHEFKAELFAITDLGIKRERHEQIKNHSPRVEGNKIITDERSHYYTYLSWKRWLEHYECGECGSSWTLKKSKLVDVTSVLFRKTWTELRF